MCIELICTVRGCAQPLAPGDRTLRCAAGHSFDRARAGYWNLLQPQDRRSDRAGDRPEAVDARERWLGSGHLASLGRRLAELAGEFSAAVDVGCGTGGLVGELISDGAPALCGIDLSSRAIQKAARSHPRATWVVANADRGLPLADCSVDLALSIFGRRPVTELERVLVDGGRLIVAIPAADDLVELREAALGEATEVDRVAGLETEFAGSRLVLDSHEVWRERIGVGREEIEDLMAMTYRAVRHRQQERLLSRLQEDAGMQVTLSADLFCFRRAPRD